MRPVRLAALLLRRSPLRAIMLTVLVAVSIVIFALVTELSRISQQGIDDAIVRDNGLRGSYTISFDPGLQLTDEQQYEAVTHAAHKLKLTLWGFSEQLPAVESECPPFQQTGEQNLRVLWTKPGVPFDLPFGHISGADTEWCVNGQSIPASALFLANDREKSVYGDHLYISSYYRNLILLSTLGPIRDTYTVVSGSDTDISGQLRQAVTAAAATSAQQTGNDAAAGIVVLRADRNGQNVKDAAAGLSVTYGVIAWGVIILAALALLVMQTSYVRQRLWFYGLMQSLGATYRRVTAILLIDAAAVITTGLALALVTLWAADSTISEFAHHAFGVQAHTISGALIPKLAIGCAIILTVATAAPVAITLRRDPLDVLEAPRD